MAVGELNYNAVLDAGRGVSVSCAAAGGHGPGAFDCGARGEKIGLGALMVRYGGLDRRPRFKISAAWPAGQFLPRRNVWRRIGNWPDRNSAAVQIGFNIRQAFRAGENGNLSAGYAAMLCRAA
jgi:hypothetical protein